MVMTFFRRGGNEAGLEHITARTVSMISDARHSFDLASTALLSGANVETVGEDVRQTDIRINEAEQELRGQLVVHVSVQGAGDIGEVLGLILLIKKIERIGDQTKNILYLAEDGADLSQAADIDTLVSYRRTISTMLGQAADVLAAGDEDGAADLRDRSNALQVELTDHIRELMHSDEPGREVVPRAILYRYWKRIVANIAGVVTTATEPLQHQGYEDDGTVDIDD